MNAAWKHGSREKLLLVDDECYVLDSLNELLSLQGYRVDTAISGVAALEKLDAANERGELYDLVLTDLVMQPTDGMQVLEKARDIDSGVIVILMTGYATVDSAVKSIRNGAYEYLLKPFLIPDLMTTIERGLEKRRLFQENRRLINSLKDKNKELETALKQLKTAQSQLIDSAQKSAIKETINRLRHEIINPLTIILSRVQLIMEQNNTKHSESNEFNDYLEIIQNQSVRISSIVANLDKSVKASVH
jgi:DNA-binding NtrC family response regulator